MGEVLYWFGLIHAVVYSIVGLMLVLTRFMDWFFSRASLKADIILSYGRLLKERRDEKDQSHVG